MYQEYLNQLQASIAPLSSEELKCLLNDEEKLDEQVNQVLEVLVRAKDNLLLENRSKAEKNIDKEPKIIELRGKVQELIEQGKQCCDNIQDKLTQLTEKSGNVSQETALALLQTSAAEGEEESEDLVQQFKSGDINVDAFVEQFLVARKTMHLRKVKAEKMQELMRRPQASQQSAGPAYSNYPASGFYPTPQPPAHYGGGVPYPMGPMMPMPPRPY